MLNKVKKFNYKNIYFSDRIKPSIRYFELVLTEIYNTLKSCFDGKSVFSSSLSLQKFYPKLYKGFSNFLYHFYDFPNRSTSKFKNKILFSDGKERDFYHAILLFISGMTDNYTIEIYHEIIG